LFWRDAKTSTRDARATQKEYDAGYPAFEASSFLRASSFGFRH